MHCILTGIEFNFFFYIIILMVKLMETEYFVFPNSIILQMKKQTNGF